jgi:CMP-N,N'-diacetyllegionaminic acid synthase
LESLAIIPARGGSKGIARKNLREIGGRPLIEWSIRAALSSARLGRVVVSTDDAEIADVARRVGADVPFRRPPELALDTTPTEPVMLHALDELQRTGYRPDVVVLLQPTSPVRRPGSIDAALELLEHSGADSVLSVCENHHFFWKNRDAPQALYDYRHRPRRQDIGPAEQWYRENGSIYVTRTSVLRSERNRLGGRIAMHVVSEAESWEVDSEADLRVVEALMAEMHAHDH